MLLFCSIENRKINKEAFDTVNEIYHDLFETIATQIGTLSKE
jgi:hypothetical protein